MIMRDDLIMQWVAEGCVSHSHGKDLEHVAKSYFNELINRSLIQPESTDTEGIVSCRVHDMMLDLILSKCAEDNFVSVAYNAENIGRQNDYKVRRLSMYFRAAGEENGMISLTIANSLTQVRSLALFANSMCMPSSLLFFECLRVMVAGDASAVIELPTEIHGLQYLETLELERLKVAGWQLPRVPRWICKDLGNLGHLNLLVKVTSTDDIHVLAELPSLTILYLNVIDRPKGETTIIFGMGFPALEQLYFCCGRDAPSYLHFLPGVLPKLQHLEIYFDEWEWGGAPPDGMDHLLGLRSLEVYMCFHCSESGHSLSYRRATDNRAGCVFADATQ
ncbi:hypothetical protein PR202_gb29259 [Eleusine coracana subsp. coracana]|uniref:Uncharacterized protein n=1 Tax=Eleusine coracana subsp. coracana TaxID=191504 RepID=A0AAV5FYH9_ELECO|nr:hypothetical protein PR202_gb29259 [Eleusine coracana subsp. coracana]